MKLKFLKRFFFSFVFSFINSFGAITEVNSIDYRTSDYIIIGGSGKTVELREVSGKSTTLLDSEDVTNVDVTTVNSVSWSCTGKYTSVGLIPTTNSYDPLQVYFFDEGELTIAQVATSGCGASAANLNDDLCGIFDTDWNSPAYPSRSTSTMYVAAVGDCINSSTGFAVYEFTGGALTEIDTVDFGENIALRAVSWKPGTSLIAIGGGNLPASYSYDVLLYEFSNDSLSVSEERDLATSGTVSSLDWSPNNAYLAVGMKNNLYVVNDDLTKANGASDITVACGAQVNSVKWIDHGRYIIVGCNVGAGNEVQVYLFDEVDKTLTSIDTINYGTEDIKSVGWSTDSAYKYFGGTNSGSVNFQDVIYGNLSDSDFKKSDWTLQNKEFMEGSAYVRDTLFLADSANIYFSLYDGAINNVVSSDSRMTLSADLVMSGTLRDSDTTLSFSGDEHTIYFSEDQTLSDLKITASNIILDANGKTFNLNGTRVIRSCGASTGSTVHIKNCTLAISSQEALYMEDTTSSFIFEDCILDLSCNCSIDIGSVEFRGDVVVTGNGYSFILGGYSHTIASDSNVTIDEGVSLCLTPTRSDGTFLTFADDSSLLTLQGATLNIYENMRSDISGNNLVLDGACTINTVYYGDTYNPLSATTAGEVEFENAVIGVKENLNLSRMSMRLK